MGDNLDLLLRVRGDAGGAKNAVEETRRAIAQLKDRIREVRTESDVGFKTERIQALNTRLTELNKTHQAAKDAVKKTTEAHRDFESALGTLSPRLGNLASLLTGSVGPTTALALGMTAVAGAVVAAGAAVFQITKSAAEFQGKMFDLSQQTGVAVETLSTLEIVAETTGGNIDAVAQSLFQFQRKLADAQDPTSKEAALLKSLGIEFTNTEDALRKTLTVLAAMPEGFEQTNAAAELFGARGGKQVLALLKEMDGDLDGTMEKFREMGILITTDVARSADQFNDQLKLLGFQFRALTGVVASEAMPTILKAINDLSSALSENRESISLWTGILVDAGRGALLLGEHISGIIPLLRELGNIFPQEGSTLARLFSATPLGGGVTALAALSRRLEGPFGGLTGGAGGVSSGGVGPVRTGAGGGKGGGSARADAERRAAREIALIQRELEESTRVHRIALERERELDLKNIQEWEDESITAATNRLAQQQIIFDRERDAAKQFIKNKQDLSLALREIDQKDEKAQNDLFIAIAQVQDEARKRRDRATLETERQLSQIRVAQREGEIERIGILLDRQAIQESDAITRILQIEKEAHDERILLINTELALRTTSAARAEELINQKEEVEQRYTDKFVRLTRERIDALNEEAAARGPGSGGIGEPDFAGIGARIEAEIGPPPMETFDLWKDAFTELKNIGANAMADLAFGVGSLIENWVLLGETGPKAMRKLVASVLAGVAAQAAVKAIYELAEGFAALFVNPAAAAAHFTSAAIFGSIAGVAAIAGRAVAGDAFQHSGRHGDGSGAGGDRGQLSPLTLQRNGGGQQFAPQIQPLKDRLDIRISVDDGRFGKAVQATIIDDINNRGPVGEIIAGDGNFNRG